MGGLLWAVSPKDGSRLTDYKLDSPPVWDGMAAAPLDADLRWTSPDAERDRKDFVLNASVDLPAGKQDVVVRCIGKDWLMVDACRIADIVVPRRPPLRATGVVGKTKRLIWLQNPDYTWSHAQRSDFEPYVVKSSTFRTNSVRAGRWRIEQWDAQTGRPQSASSGTARQDGTLEIVLPGRRRDHALKLFRFP